jgi:hypothetical protein
MDWRRIAKHAWRRMETHGEAWRRIARRVRSSDSLMLHSPMTQRLFSCTPDQAVIDESFTTD